MSSLLTNLKVNSDGYLYIPYSEDFNFGSGDFTIEFWIKVNSRNDSIEKSILTKGWGSGSTGSFLIYLSATNILFYASDNGTAWTIASAQPIATNVSLNKWHYITVTRSGSIFKTFANGMQTSSWSNGASLYNSSSHGVTIGNSEAGTHPVDCNIDGLRITKGVCRYSSNFNLSFNDASLVTEGAFKDRSRFSKRVLNNNYVSTNQNIKQFGDSSAYFNGSSYLSVPGDKAWQLGTDDFTVEAWINPDTVTNISSIVGNYDGSDGGWRLAVDSSTIQFRNGNSTVIQTSISPPLASGVWKHIAASRASGVTKLFLDGDEIGVSNDTYNISRVNVNGLTVGASRSSGGSVTDAYQGYIDDLRITKGTARYSTIFTKPAAPAPNLGIAPIAPSSPSGLAVTERDNVFKVSLTPPTSDGRSPITAYNFQYSEDGSTWNNTSVVSDPYYDKVSLLLPMTGSNNSTNIVDDSKHNHNVGLVGNVKVVSSESWFGNGSVVFDGTSDNLVIQNNSAFDLTNQDWTIEGWIRPTGDWSKFNIIISKRGNGGGEGTDGDWQLYLRQSNGVLSFYTGTTGQESGSTPLVNIWNHVAAVRNGRIITLYLNGISVLSFVADTLYTANRKVYVGGWSAGNEYFYGNMNDVRVTKGVARYITNFDPRNLVQAPANRVSGLSTLGTPYIFRARSVNAIGSSSYSSSTTSAISVLGAPSDLNIIPDIDRAYLSWTAPTSNNSAIRDYSVQHSSNGGSTWTDYAHTPSIDTSIVVSGLVDSTNYLFQVAAINIAGTGNYVTSSSPVLTELRQDNTHNKTRLLLHLDSN